jgi:hypothetical protein
VTGKPPAWLWIWTGEPSHASETLFFRQKLVLAKPPISAKLLITAADGFTLYINEHKRPAAHGNDWRVVQEVDVTSLLKAGPNLLATEVVNGGGQGGLLYKLQVNLPGGERIYAVTDSHVHVTRRAPAVWTTVALDDSKWPQAKEIAPANGGQWGPLHGAPSPDPTRLVRVWKIHTGEDPDEDPYTQTRSVGDRMLLCSSMASPSDLQVVANAGFTLFQTDSDHLSTEQTGPDRWNFTEQLAALNLAHSNGLDWCYFPHFAFPPPWYRQSVPFTRIQCLEHKLPVEAFSPWDPTWPKFIDNGYVALAQAFLPPPPKLVPEPPAEKHPIIPAPEARPSGASAGGSPAAGVALSAEEGSARLASAPPGPERSEPAGAPELAKPPAPKVSALYVGIHGDYGEAGLLMGARTAAGGQREDWQRRFGNLHDHLGWWCHDPLARADFRAAMLRKYENLAGVNTAWKRQFKSPEEIVYPEAPRAENSREWLDFADWYYGSVGAAITTILTTARAHFPDTLLMLPAGFGDENPRGGNDNSLIPKLAAAQKVDVRSTHAAFKPFAENTSTMLGRLGSASRFYGAPFWTEPPGGITADEEVSRIFEAVSQGAKGIFDWSENVIANREIYYRYGKLLRLEKPVVDVAMYYPSTAMRLRPDVGFAPTFAQACANMRQEMNFDIVDDRMIQDGCLSGYRVLVMWEGNIVEQSTLDKIRSWVNDGGVLTAYDFGKIRNVEGDLGWFDEMFGYVREMQPAKVTEKYVGEVPAQFRIALGQPEASDYLGGDWYEPDTMDGVTRRWAGAQATVRLPVDPDRTYNLVVRAAVPAEAASLKRQILVNGVVVGNIESPGDVTYRFRVPENAIEDHPLSTLTFQSETFVPAKLQPGSTDTRNLGVWIHSVQMVEQGNDEARNAGLPPGTLRRELDIQKLSTDWARRYGKGLTVYFPANRKLIRGYMEVVRRAVYNLSSIFPGHRNAIQTGLDHDGVYSTLFTDRILYYNSTDAAVSKTLTIPASAFASWRGEVATPTETTWHVTVEPHAISMISLVPLPQELLLECEKFSDLAGIKPWNTPDCSPGRGPTCVHVPAGVVISTRFTVEAPGRYNVFLRATRRGKLESAEVLVDGEPLQSVNAASGQTLLVNGVNLSRGVHTIAVRAHLLRDIRADFVILTNDPTVAGYNFGVKTVTVE